MGTNIIEGAARRSLKRGTMAACKIRRKTAFDRESGKGPEDINDSF